MLGFIRELKRRKVFNVTGSYAVIAWVVIQVVVTVKEPLGLPDWADTVTIVALLLGFPLCVILAWVYDYSGGEIEKTPESAAAASRQRFTLTEKVTAILSVMAVVLLLVSSGYLVAINFRQASPTLAILPFATADDAENSFLGDGIRDSLITRLSRLPGLRIKTAGSEQAMTDAKATGRALGVDYINTGRIEQRGDSYVIVTELIDVADGSIQWRESYPGGASSMLNIESSIAQEISIQLGLSAGQQEMLARASTSNPAAHRLYLQGRYYWNRRTPDGFENSIRFYQDALALDPNFALAHAGLSQTYLMLLGWGLRPPDEVAMQIVEQAQLAISLDPTLAEPHAALGYYHTLHTRDWEQARSEFLQAIQLNSNYSSAHHWYAFLLMTLGDMDAAITEILLARELEPLSPIINAEVGYFYTFDRQYDQARAVLSEALALDGNFLSTVQYLARAHIGLGQPEQAREYIELWRVLSPNNELLGIAGAMLLPQLGMADEAWQIYEQAVADSRERYIMPGLLGITAAALGDFDAAVDYINAGLLEGSMVLSWLRDPLLEAFQQDPRYQAIMLEAGLPP